MAALFKDVVDPVPDDASPLHQAVLEDSIDDLNELINAGADLYARDRNGATALHWAAAANSSQAVDRLLEAGVSPHVRSGDDSNPLHWGASYGSTESVDRLLEAGVVLHSRDHLGRTSLHFSGSGLSPETVGRLLEAGADPNARNHREETPLHHMSFSQSPESVELLLRAGADPNARSGHGWTPLHHATDQGASRSMDLLLEAGADPDSRGFNGRTALHDAASLNAPHLADRLIAAGADVNVRDNRGLTPLHYSAAAWASDTVDRLLEAGADPQVQDKDRNLTPLHHAINRDRIEVVNRLLEAGTDPNTRDSEDSTLLHEAARHGSPEMVERLIAAGADVNARDNRSRTALHEAATLGSPEVADRLIKAGAAVNFRDEEGRTALHMAAIEGSPETAKRLLEARADPNVRDSEGKTAYEYGTKLEPGADEYRKVFEEHQAQHSRQEQQHITPAAKHAEEEPLRERSPAMPESPAMAARADDVNAVDQYGDDALHRAAESGSVYKMDRLLKAGANFEVRDTYGATPLHVAVAYEQREAVERLLKAGADLHARDRNGDTPLHYAAVARSPGLTDRLLQAGADPHARNNDGATPVHAITVHRTHIEPGSSSIETLDRLVKAGDDSLLPGSDLINTQDKAGNTALHFLAEGRKPDAGQLAEAFLERGARLDLANAQGRTPLDTAAADRDVIHAAYARVVKEVFDQHQERQQTTPPRRDPPQQRKQQAFEQAAPQKRRWWRRSNSTPREGGEGKARKSSRPSARDYAKEASERVIKQLEKGVAPWQKPWDTPSGANEPPHNPVSKTRYRGLNSIVLRAESEERGYSDPRWVTYNQAKQLGAHVRKGEHGTRIEYWKFPSTEEGKDKGDSKPAEDGRYSYERPILHRTYTVFNAEQIDNMPQREQSQPQKWEASERADRLIKESGADIVHVHGDRAFYRPSDDKIVLPKREQFPTHEAYYSTAIHEMGHWTGHKDRLDRETLREAGKPETGGYGSEAYAKEELRAEMTSMTVNGVMKLPHDPERHASYVDSWIKVLKEDPNELRHAARDAGAAADYLLQYDRDRPREVEPSSRQEDYTSPMPERPLSRSVEPQRQPSQEQEVSLSR